MQYREQSSRGAIMKRQKIAAKSSIFKSRRTQVAGLAALAFVALLLTGLRASEEPKASAPDAVEAAVKVINENTLQLSAATLADLGTVKAATQDYPETLGLMGSISVVENMVTVVPSRVGNGRVDQVLKVTGESVRAGEPLALLYSPDYVSAREEYLQIIGKTGGPQGQVADAAASTDLMGFADVARKKLEMMGLSAKDIADLPNNTDNHLVVRAIRDGAITSVNTMVGNLQNQGDTLFTTANLDRVWFSGDLYIEDLPKVHKGQKIMVSAEGLDKPLNGTLSFISPVVDPNVRTVKVRAIIENPDHLLRASMFVQGNLVLSDAPALLVPQNALLKLNDKTFCFKEIGQNRFQEVPVTVSRQDDSVASIAQGLNNGDEIVAKDIETLDHVLDAGRVSD
jgi:Cu(I)/Ag(I) efflux system membrane fusion protein